MVGSPRPLSSQPGGDPLLGLGDVEAVEAELVVGGVDRRALAGERGVEVVVVGGLHGADDRQVEGLGEVPVALVLAGHRHDRAGAVAHQHVVGDEHRDAGAGDRVGRPAAGEDTGLVLALALPLDVVLARCRAPVGRDGLLRGGRAAGPGVLGALGPAAGRDQLVDERVLGGQHHEGRAEQGVGPGREDLDPRRTCIDQLVTGGTRGGEAPASGVPESTNWSLEVRAIGKVTLAPELRPIQFRCMIRTFSGQSTRSRSSASRSA